MSALQGHKSVRIATPPALGIPEVLSIGIVALDMCKLGSPVWTINLWQSSAARYLGIHGSIRLLQLDITCHEWIRDAQVLRYRK